MGTETKDPTGAITKDNPILQPKGFDPNDDPRFSSSEIWWWNNGVWGKAGYAIPNDGGKPTTANQTIYAIHRFIGSELFALMHQPDVKFSRPFNADWLFDLTKMLRLGIKRMGDMAVGWTDERHGDADHAQNTQQAFTVFPVPYFGERIRQQDARRWCGQILKALGEIMQHSDNEYDDDVTDMLASKVQEDLRRILADVAMKYLGMDRAATEALDFTIADDAFSDGKYDPSKLFTSQEMVEERMPDMWWPTANDLTPIKGVPAPVANVFAERWPEAGAYYGDGGAVAAAWPGSGSGYVPKPGARPT